MALQPDELQQVKYLLGYGNLTASARPYFDVAIIFEEVVLQNLDTTWAEGYVRNTLLPNVFALDAQIQNSAVRLQATAIVGEFELDARNELRGLQGIRDYWIDELSSILKVPRVPTRGGNAVELC